MSKLGLDPRAITKARAAAASVADEMDAFIRERSTVAVERTSLRLVGIDGVDADEVPLPNVVVDSTRDAERLAGGNAHGLGPGRRRQDDCGQRVLDRAHRGRGERKFGAFYTGYWGLLHLWH